MINKDIVYIKLRIDIEEIATGYTHIFNVLKLNHFDKELLIYRMKTNMTKIKPMHYLRSVPQKVQVEV